jgi:hypothetical protein
LIASFLAAFAEEMVPATRTWFMLSTTDEDDEDE